MDPRLPHVESDLRRLEMQVNASEGSLPNVKPDNQARIIWAEPMAKQKTPFSVVYLHGLGGSLGDGMGVHTAFARRYGCNLYLSRLHGHGLVTENALGDLTPENYFDSAKYAISVGERLGDRVIVMGTSTGGSLALIIAASHPEIAGLILFSPNIDFYDQATDILTAPWGLGIAKLVRRSRFIASDDPERVRKYWYSKYRLEGVAAVKNLLNNEMNEKTFSMIHQPLFVGYYYKNESSQDDRVSVPRMLQMYDEVGTPPDAKRKVAFPTAGVHPIASELISQDVESVRVETYKFAEEVLHLVPVTRP
jgi:pimeloyl-ACP methyl ester carboxylesterase